MKILIVEDELSVKSFLASSFKREGFQVAEAESMEDFEDFIGHASGPPDLVVLDRLLGERDSLTLLKAFKASFPECAIMVLSAVNTSDEKATALDMGADDYVAKPFSIVELTARARALLRRGKTPQAAPFLKTGDLLLDLALRQVKLGSQKLDITPKEFMLLHLLATNPSRIWNKYQLLEKIWDSAYDVQSNVVEVTVRSLRLKLEAVSSKAQIMNRRNIGYWLEV